jgi:hypothetical protein
MTAGNTAAGVLLYDSDRSLTVIWKAGGRANCGRVTAPARAAPWHLPG